MNMNLQELNLTLSLIETGAIVLSLALVFYQLREVSRGLKENAYDRAVDDYSQMMVQLLDKPNLNKLFYEENAVFKELNDDQKDFYNYMALSFALFERIFLLWKKGDIEPHIWDSWERWLTEWFRPQLFVVFWSHERTFFTIDFYQFVDQQYQEFEESRPAN
jgi:hypothetical protein